MIVNIVKPRERIRAAAGDDKPNANNKNSSTKIHTEKISLTKNNPAVRQLTFQSINNHKDPIDDNYLDFKISLDVGATTAAKAEIGGIGFGVKLGASMEVFNFSIREGDYKETTVNTQILDFKNTNPKTAFEGTFGMVQLGAESEFSMNGTNKPIPFGFASPTYQFGVGGVSNSYNSPKQETTFFNFSIGTGAVVNMALKYVSSGHGFPTGKPRVIPMDNTRVYIPILQTFKIK